MWSLARPLFACPACRAPLRSGSKVLICGRCRTAYPVTGGVPRLLPPGSASSRTLRAFERQWRRYGGLRRLFGKDPAGMAANLTGPRLSRRIDVAWYRGRRVLDAGCGHGRYLAAFAALGAEVVGIDAGRGPELAGVDLDHPRIAVVQGSVLALPFRDASFDLVFCDGVLHHTPDPAAGYRELARVVRPGGVVYVWVYPREGRLRTWGFGAARAVTTRLPAGLVRLVAFAGAPLTWFVRSYSGTRLGRATWAECAQVVHDWIAPPIQSHHTMEEVEGWARDAGLGDLERLPVPIGLTAWRPPA
jgi:SAM-dependent methyltransferase